MRRRVFELTRPQYDAVHSTARYVVFLAGVGAGKSTSIGAALARRVAVPYSLHALCAPDLKVLRQATLPAVMKVLDALGYKRGVHYVVNVRPPEKWGLRRYTEISHNRLMTFRNGATVILDGLVNYDSIRGTSLDCAFVDEFRDVKAPAWEVLKSRMRGAAYARAGLPHQIMLFTTPPDDIELLSSIVNDPNAAVIRAGSSSNPFLPAGYVEELARTMAPTIYRREVEAELIPLTSNLFAFEFRRDEHVAKVRPFEPGETVLLSFDFNVTPACATAWRDDGEWLECVKEFRVETCSLDSLCELIKNYYGTFPLLVTGDASGRARQGANASLLSMYDLIRSNLGISQRQLLVPRANQSHKESWALVNSLFSRGKIRINETCGWLVRDLETVAYDPVHGIDKKDPERGHLLDTLRYAFRAFRGDWLRPRGYGG